MTKSGNHAKSFNGARMTLMNISHFLPITCNVWQIHSNVNVKVSRSIQTINDTIYYTTAFSSVNKGQ